MRRRPWTAPTPGSSFWNVTIPMSTPVILFNLIIGFINAFQEFTSAWLITNGGPANSTLFYSLYLYRQAFQFLRMGKASALAWILFLMIVIFSVILFRTSARWVYYGGEKVTTIDQAKPLYRAAESASKSRAQLGRACSSISLQVRRSDAAGGDLGCFRSTGCLPRRSRTTRRSIPSRRC